MEIINIKINRDATLEYAVRGVKGSRCKDLTRLIDAIAGGNVLETKVTGEFSEPEQVNQTLKQNT